MSRCVQDTVLGTTWEDINNTAPAQKELRGQVEEYWPSKAGILKTT